MPGKGHSIDVHQLIAEVASRHKLLLKPDDPAIALVTINELVLEAAINIVHGEVRETIAEFQASMQKAEKRAGSMLAQTVRESTVQMQEELQNDIHSASLRAREIVHLVNEAHRRPALIRWTALGLLAGVVMFGGGVWLGTLLR